MFRKLRQEFFDKTCVRNGNGIVLVLLIVSVAAFNGVRITRSGISDGFENEAVRCRQISSRCFQGYMTKLADTADLGSLRAFVDATEKDGLVQLLYRNVDIDSIVNYGSVFNRTVEKTTFIREEIMGWTYR